MKNMASRLGAELFGTFWLVLGGCGSAVLAANFVPGGIGLLGVALAFGLTVLTMAYAVGTISGGHFNPAVTFGLAVGGRFPWRDVIPYVVAQLVGAVIAAAVLFLIATGRAGATVGNFAANGYGAHSPGGYGLPAAWLCETVMTFFFVLVVLGATHKRAPAGFAGLAIGLALTIVHLVSIPVTNTSVNPARSTSQALFAHGGWALPQLWLFWFAPLLGAALAGLTYQLLFSERRAPVVGEKPTGEERGSGTTTTA